MFVSVLNPFQFPRIHEQSHNSMLVLLYLFHTMKERCSNADHEKWLGQLDCQYPSIEDSDVQNAHISIG